MAKKKSRSANVARKREKRNRDRKFKHKQLAVEKQRRLPYGKMDEERLHTCLLRSRDLLEEPELERVHFNLDLMYTEVVKFLNDIKITANAEPEALDVREETQFLENSDIPPPSQDSDETCEKFRTEVLPLLITPNFMRTLFSALTNCENRFRRIGDRDRVDVVFVTRSFFEVVPPDIYAEHPLIEGIGIQTLRLLSEHPAFINEQQSDATNILSDVFEIENSEYQDEKLSSLLSEAIVEEPPFSEVGAPQVADSSPLISAKPAPVMSQPIPSPDTLPAKALYKNFEGLAIKEVLKEWQGHTLEKETATQLEYSNQNRELYITVTENRVQLHTYSEEKLTVAMEELEAHCQSALMYLAKTYEEGGKTDATE